MENKIKKHHIIKELTYYKFTSLVEGDLYYSLDGKFKLDSSEYCKYVNNINELTTEEQAYLQKHNNGKL